MRVGMPVFNSRISPVFDWAKKLLIVDVDSNGKKVSERIVDIPGHDLYSRVDLLVDNKVEILICAGICMALMQMIMARGVSVIPGIVGEVDEVIEALVKGNIEEPRFMMPGFGRFKGRMWGRRSDFPRGKKPGMGRRFWNNNVW